MAVRKRLERQWIQESEVDALIEKGAKVKEDHIAENKKWAHVNIRIPVDMLKNVDKCVDSRVGITRTGWILEAIHEKIKRENETQKDS